MSSLLNRAWKFSKKNWEFTVPLLIVLPVILSIVVVYWPEGTVKDNKAAVDQQQFVAEMERDQAISLAKRIRLHIMNIESFKPGTPDRLKAERDYDRTGLADRYNDIMASAPTHCALAGVPMPKLPTMAPKFVPSFADEIRAAARYRPDPWDITK